MWLGSDSDPCLLAHVMLNYNAHASLLFHPATNRLRRDVRPLMARYFFLTENAKFVWLVGILVDTLGVANYLAVLRGLQATPAPGELPSTNRTGLRHMNEPKLSNFAEIDLFVLAACPLSVMFDGCDIATGGLRADVVTPFEMMMALRGDEWTGEYVRHHVRQRAKADGQDGWSRGGQQGGRSGGAGRRGGHGTANYPTTGGCARQRRPGARCALRSHQRQDQGGIALARALRYRCCYQQ